MRHRDRAQLLGRLGTLKVLGQSLVYMFLSRGAVMVRFSFEPYFQRLQFSLEFCLSPPLPRAVAVDQMGTNLNCLLDLIFTLKLGRCAAALVSVFPRHPMTNCVCTP